MTSNTKVSRGGGGPREGAEREVSSAATAVAPPGEAGAGQLEHSPAAAAPAAAASGRERGSAGRQ